MRRGPESGQSEGQGDPLCCQIFHFNTAPLAVLIPVLRRMQTRRELESLSDPTTVDEVSLVVWLLL